MKNAKKSTRKPRADKGAKRGPKKVRKVKVIESPDASALKKLHKLCLLRSRYMIKVAHLSEKIVTLTERL